MKKLLLIALLFLFTFAWGSPFIFGDGYGYFHVGKQLSANGNFVSKEPPSYLDHAGHSISYFNDKYVTVYSPAGGIIWSPLLFAVRNIEDPIDVAGQTFVEFNGHTFWEGSVILMVAAMSSLLSFWFIFQGLKFINFDEKDSFISTFYVFLSTYLIGYVMTNGSYSHVYELLGASGMFYFLIKYSHRFSNFDMFWSGVFGSFMVLARLTNAVIILPTLLYVFLFRSKKAFVYYCFGGVPLLLVLMLYNFVSYGAVFASGYTEVWGVGLSLSEFNLLKLLFSDVRGLYVWSPLAFIATVGLVKYSVKSKQNAILYLTPFLLTMLIMSFWENWWGGDSIGQRFFIVLIPYLCIGLAYIFKLLKDSRFKIQLHTLILILVAFSFTTLILHRFTPTVEISLANADPAEVTETERFGVFDIWEYHIELVSNSKNLQEYSQNLQSNLNGGRSYLMLLMDE